MKTTSANKGRALSVDAAHDFEWDFNYAASGRRAWNRGVTLACAVGRAMAWGLDPAVFVPRLAQRMRPDDRVSLVAALESMGEDCFRAFVRSGYESQNPKRD